MCGAPYVTVVSKTAYDEAVREAQSGAMREAAGFLRSVGGGGGGGGGGGSSGGPLGQCSPADLANIVFLSRHVTAEKVGACRA